MTFPLQEVLKMWSGYFMTMWQPPIIGVTKISPYQVSEAVIWIRKHIDLNWDDSRIKLNSTHYNNELKHKILQFQGEHGLVKDGIVGSKTFIHLQNNSPLNRSPLLKLND
jgi:general secretion pathway protein A